MFAIHLASGTSEKITGIGDRESKEKWEAKTDIWLLSPDGRKLLIGQGTC